MRRRSLLAAAALLVAAAGRYAPRATAAADPAAMIQDLGNRTLSVLRRELPPQERLANFRALFDRYFDVPGIARFVLGRYWPAASPSERAQFVSLFDRYITQAYSIRLSQYAGETFEVTGSRPIPDGVLVESRIIRLSGAAPIRVEWRLSREAGGWRITDVIVDDVSLAVTQRDEFASVIARSGGQVAGLMQAMREKLEGAAGE
jgi:phospholipid transport system substrate-binding protein